MSTSQNNKSRLAVGLLVVGAIAVGVLVFKKQLFKSGPIEDPETAGYIQILKDENSPIPDRSRAILFLTRRLHPFGREVAMTSLKAEGVAKEIRQASALGLTRFADEEAEALLTQVLAQADVEVHVRILDGFGETPNAKRYDQVIEFLAREDIADDEKLAGQTAILRMTKAGFSSDNSEAFTNLLEVGADPKANKQEMIFMQLLNIMPDDPKVKEMIYTVLRSQDFTPNVQSTAIRHLAATNDSWLRENYRKYLNHPNAMVRQGIVQSLHFFCPEDRWSLLKTHMEKEQDDTVIHSILSEPLNIRESAAQEFLKGLMGSGRLSTEQGMKAQEVLTEITSNPRGNFCVH